MHGIRRAEQHDAHVRKAREMRTVFYSETVPGQGVRLIASYGIPMDKLAWAALRMIEGKRLEMSGAWRDDLERLLGNQETLAK